MASLDVGILPVGEGDRLVGIIADRDIAVRGLVEGKGRPDATVRDAMTPEIKYCFARQEINEITVNMANIQVRRLPILNRESVWSASSRCVISPSAMISTRRSKP